MDDHPLFVICSQMMADFCALVDRAALLVDPNADGRTAIAVEAGSSVSGPAPAPAPDHDNGTVNQELLEELISALPGLPGLPPLNPPASTSNAHSLYVCTQPQPSRPTDPDGDAIMNAPTPTPASVSPPAPPPTTFPLFPSLPQELQDRVWSHVVSCATPRVHSLDVVPRFGAVILSPTDALVESTRPSRLLGLVSRAARSAVERELPHVVELMDPREWGRAGGERSIHIRIDARAGGDVVLLNRIDGSIMDLFNAGAGGGPEGPEAVAGIRRLGLPEGVAQVAISVPDDSYYRAFNVWPLGWSDGATNVLRRFVLGFPALRTLFLKAGFPVLGCGVAQARALIRDLSDPEWQIEAEEGRLAAYLREERRRLGKKRVLGHSWLRGTAELAAPPWFQSWEGGRVPALPGPGAGSCEMCAKGVGGSRALLGVEGRDESSGSGYRSRVAVSRKTPDEEDAPDEGKVWYLAAKPYHNWGAGIPALSKVMDANLWRKARFRKVMGGRGDDVGLSPEEVRSLQAVDVSMLLEVEW